MPKIGTSFYPASSPETEIENVFRKSRKVKAMSKAVATSYSARYDKLSIFAWMACLVCWTKMTMMLYV